MLMYFNFRQWWRLVVLAAHESSPRRRFRLYVRLFVFVPVAALLTAICFALDPLLFPRLRRIDVKSPVFIVGHARSGTTLVHRLMSEDSERFSVFRLWELWAPSLLQKKIVHAIAALDARYLGGWIEGRVRAREERKFGPTQHVHKMGYTIPEEDEFIFTLSCDSGWWIVLLPYMGDIDFYHIDQRTPAERKRMMDYYRECVRRQLYVNGDGKLHLSKNPVFTGRVETLIEAFPDASFVLPYRNPFETVPSLLKLMKISWKMRHFDEARMKKSLAVMAAQSFHAYNYPLQVLERHPHTRRAIVDYRELVAAPKATMERVYADLGFTMSPDYARALDAEQARAGKHETAHSYSLEEFGLSEERIRAELAPLFERFGWDAPDA